MADKDDENLSLSGDDEDDEELEFGEEDEENDNKNNNNNNAGSKMQSFPLPGTSAPPNQNTLKNLPHDHAQEIDDGEHFVTPRDGGHNTKVTASSAGAAAASSSGANNNEIKNKPFDLA